MRIRTIALFCGLAFLAPTVAAGALEPRPGEVVHSFYAWYFSPSVKGLAFNHLSGARHFMTRSFWELLARVRPYEQVHGEVLEADPFIDAQIPASSVSLGSSFYLQRRRHGYRSGALPESSFGRTRQGHARQDDRCWLADRRHRRCNGREREKNARAKHEVIDRGP